MRIQIMIVTSLIFFSGCGANLKKVSCAGKDWRQAGYDTALKGQPVRSFESQRDSCQNPPEDAAKREFIDGFTRGIIEYCTYDTGFAAGAANENLKDVCPAEVRAGFIKGYKHGQLEYTENIRRMDRMADQNERNALRPEERPAQRPADQ